MKVNIGTKGEYQFTTYLDHYVKQIDRKYEGEAVDTNKKTAIRVIDEGRMDWKKLTVIGGVVCLTALTGEVTTAFAMPPGQSIPLGPVDYVFGVAYWTMVKIASLVGAPLGAWAGYNLTIGGAEEHKRTIAKKIGKYCIIGAGVMMLAPWGWDQIMNVWRMAVR